MPNALKRGSATLDKLAAGFKARRAGHITGGELDLIIAECGDTTAAIERDSAIAWNMGCQTRQAVREGRASWA